MVFEREKRRQLYLANDCPDPQNVFDHVPWHDSWACGATRTVQQHLVATTVQSIKSQILRFCAKM